MRSCWSAHSCLGSACVARQQSAVLGPTCYPMQPQRGTSAQGYAKAEVTGGGVPLDEVDCATLESRLRPGLFVCGELIDVFGRIGGFNFYWARPLGPHLSKGCTGHAAFPS